MSILHEGRVQTVKCCCNECKNKDCPVNYKNAPKGERIEYVAFSKTKLCKGYQRP